MLEAAGPDARPVLPPVLRQAALVAEEGTVLHEHGAAGVAHDEVGVLFDRLVLRLLGQRGVDDLRGRGAGAPCAVQGQDYSVDPLGQVSRGFLDLAQLLAP